jgi:hypothetical protein
MNNNIKKIISENDLREAILHLETKQAGEAQALKEQFLLAYDGVKPINLIKSTLKEAAASQELKGNLLNTSLGLTAGYLSKIFLQGLSTNPLKKILGTVLMFSIVSLVAKNPDKVKSLSSGFRGLMKLKPSKMLTEL